MTTGIRRDGGGAAALAHLFEHGPTPQDDLRAVLAERLTAKDADGYAGAQLRRLESLGLVTTKVWLTRAGLEEVRRLGLEPERAGIVQEPDAATAAA